LGRSRVEVPGEVGGGAVGVGAGVRAPGPGGGAAGRAGPPNHRCSAVAWRSLSWGWVRPFRSVIPGRVRSVAADEAGAGEWSGRGWGEELARASFVSQSGSVGRFIEGGTETTGGKADDQREG